MKKKIFAIFLSILTLSSTLFASYEIVDATGSKVSFNAPPQRVACISPSTTELIFALGGGENLVANSRYCRFPQEATKKIKIGGYLDPDFEKIVEVSPDLFIGTRSKNNIFASRLTKFAIPQVYLYEDGLENILKNIEILGEVFQKEAEAKTLIAEIQEEIAIAKHRAKSLSNKRTVLMFDKMAAGKGSYATELLDIVGAKNIMADSTSSWLVPDKEFILASAPEVIILEKKSQAEFDKQLVFYKKDPIWSKSPAVKNNKIYAIDSDLISIPCTHIKKAISQLSLIMHKADGLVQH